MVSFLNRCVYKLIISNLASDERRLICQRRKINHLKYTDSLRLSFCKTRLSGFLSSDKSFTYALSFKGVDNEYLFGSGKNINIILVWLFDTCYSYLNTYSNKFARWILKEAKQFSAEFEKIFPRDNVQWDLLYSC